MRNVSSAFKQALADDQRDYIEYANFTLEDGTTLNLTNEHFWQNGFSFEEAVSANDKFQVGSAVINKVNLTLNNIYGDFDPYDFFGATAFVGVGLQIGNAVESVQFGKFTVVEQPVYNGSLISIELYDNMFKFDQPYSKSSLVYPATLDTIVRDACTNCQVTLVSTNFPNKSYIVQTRPDDEKITFREVLAYATQIAGCYAKINADGNLVIDWFDSIMPYPYISGLQNYFGTKTGMTAIVENTRQDDQNNTLTGVDWFAFDGKTATNIYVNSNSKIQIGGTAPTSSSYSPESDVNVCRADGQMLNLYTQSGTVGGTKFYKIRYEGYTRYNTSYQTSAYKNTYELFLLSNGAMILNVINIPSNTSYLGESSIVSSRGTLTFTPSVGQFLLYETGAGWCMTQYVSTNAYHTIDSIYSHNVSTDYVVITGVKISMDVEHEVDSQTAYEKAEYLEGSEGYVIGIENNPLIVESELRTVAEYLGARLIGLTFRTASVTHGSDPSIESGDVAYMITGKGNTYPILVSKTKFAVGAAQTTESIAEEPIRNSSARFSAEVQNYVKARKRIVAEKNERKVIEDQLNERINNANGLYETEVQQTGGGVITYLHNKPILAESDIRIMVSTVGVMVTANGTDPNPTWYGLTVDGQLIANILSVAGIHADWINTGQLVITKNGSEIFFADIDTGTVRIKGDTVSITPGDSIDTAISNASSAQYGTCSTAAATVAKVVESSTFKLFTGATILVKFTYANTATSPTMNVNGTGAKAIRAKNAALASKYYWTANSLVEFAYDGTYWVMSVEDQTEVFNRLTNGQSNQGIYISGGNLYINASMINTGTLSANYINGGTLTLGGNNNVNGLLKVLNASGTEIGSWDKDGLNATGTLTMKRSSTVSSITTDYTMTLGAGIMLDVRADTSPRYNRSNHTGFLLKATNTNSKMHYVKSINMTSEYASETTLAYGRGTRSVLVSYGLTSGNNGGWASSLLSSTGTLSNLRSYADNSTYMDFTETVYAPASSSGKGYVRWDLSGYQNSTVGQTAKIELQIGASLVVGTGFSYTGSNVSLQTITGTSTVWQIKDSRGTATIAMVGSSSKRYKHNIQEDICEKLDAHRLYKLKMKQFVYNDDCDKFQYIDTKGQTLPGFIAEDVAEIYPSAVIHDGDGNIESWDERRIVPAMLKLIQEQHDEIEKLKQALHVD